jgi:hypothetical protein
MSIANYGELKTSIANHLHRTDLTNLIPDFVMYAESVIGNDPDPSDMEVLPGIRTKNQGKRVTASVSTQYFDIPTDLLELRDLEMQGNTISPLTYLSPKVMSQKFLTASADTPKFYTIHGDEFQVAPVPDTTYTIEVSYTARFAALSNDADTNWLLTNHPLIYVYGSLIAASAYLEEDATKWAMMYKSLATGINGAEKGQYGAQLSARPITATP